MIAKGNSSHTEVCQPYGNLVSKVVFLLKKFPEPGEERGEDLIAASFVVLGGVFPRESTIDVLQFDAELVQKNQRIKGSKDLR